MTQSLVSKQEIRQKLKSFPDYGQSNFAWMASLVLTIVLLANSYDFAGQAVKPFVFAVAVIYVVFTLLQLAITLKIRRDILVRGEIGKATRALGYIQLLSVATGNVFATAFAFSVIKKEKSPEYTIAVYMLLTQVFVIAVSALNMFKPYVADTFPLGMLVLLLIAIFQLIALIVIAKAPQKPSGRRWPVILAILLLLTVVTGNLFALLLSWMLIARVRNYGDAPRKWEEIWDRLARNTSAMSGLFFIVFLFSISICSLVTFDYSVAIDNNYGAILQSPSLMYPLGTDNFGRDLFSRIVFGARISLIVGILSTLIPLIIGGILGAVSGYYGRNTDNIIMRAMDILYAIPGILLAIAIIAAFGANTVNLILALSVGSIPTYARTMRANVLMVSTFEFVEAARALGARDSSIIFRHIVPNSMAPMIVKSTLTIGGAVIATSSLSYLGLGVEPHIPEWGNILKLGSAYLESNAYLAIYPGLAIMALVLSFNFLGDGLRDALDPKMD